MNRAAVLAANLERVSGEIAAACQAVGRGVDEVTLIAVTKTWPASDIRLLAELGVREFGENREQEASGKADELAGLGLTWHFIGQVQTNKAARIARFADVVHSVDRPRLAQALSRGAVAAERELSCLLQVSLDPSPDSARGGAAPTELGALAATVASLPGLRLAGLMAVAPLDEPPAAAFARLAGYREALLAEFPDARWLSAGMSGDLHEAIAAGATHLRIGSALLGNR